MLKLGPQLVGHCGGISRREVLQVGAAGALGLSLPAVVRAAAEERGLSVMVLFLRGGVAQLDTWDMKPESPRSDVRGEFRALETSVPGLQMCELLPALARRAHHLTVLRGASHGEGEHDRAMQTVLTGHNAVAGVVFPNMGAVIGRYRPGRPPLPSAIHVQTPGLGNPQAPPATADQPGLSAGLLGAAYAPFMVPDVVKLDEADWLKPAPVLPARLDRRRELLREVDRWQARSERQATGSAAAHDTAYARAFSLVTAPEAKRAFNLDLEPAALRDRYGRHEWGQSCLLGRRLIEAGVRYVQVNWSARGWEAITPKDDLFTRSTFDSHFGHFPWLRRQLPRLDTGMATLLADLHDRGLLQRTLVVVLTEFGRSATVNPDSGRDHWTRAYTVLMAGGGLPGGRVLGETDATGTEVTHGGFAPPALLNSVYHLCGLDVAVTLRQAGVVKDSSDGIPGLVT